MNAPTKRSWGHRIYKLSTSLPCSAAGCAELGHYSLQFFHSQGQKRRLNYCVHHAVRYAKSVGLTVPGELDFFELAKFSQKDLTKLRDRISQELADREKRGQTPEERVGCYFAGEGEAAGAESAYVAMLYWRNEKLERYFYNFQKQDLANGRVMSSGRYTCRKDSIVEKRYYAGGELHRNLYLVVDEDVEILVAEHADEERREKVLAFVRGEIPKEILLHGL